MNVLNFTINNEVTYTVFGDKHTLEILQRLFAVKSVSSKIVTSDEVTNILQESYLP